MKENDNGFWSHAKAKIAIAASAIGLLLVPLKNLPQETVALNRATITSSAQIPRGGAFKRLFKSFPKKTPKGGNKGFRWEGTRGFGPDDVVRIYNKSKDSAGFNNAGKPQNFPNLSPKQTFKFHVPSYTVPNYLVKPSSNSFKQSGNSVLTIPIDTMSFNRRMGTLKMEIESKKSSLFDD